MIGRRVRDRRTGEVFKVVSADAQTYTLHGEVTAAIRYEPIGSEFNDYNIVPGTATPSERRAGVIAEDLQRQADRDTLVRAAIQTGRATRAEVEAQSKGGVMLDERGDVLPEEAYPGAEPRRRGRFFSRARDFRRVLG